MEKLGEQTNNKRRTREPSHAPSDTAIPLNRYPTNGLTRAAFIAAHLLQRPGERGKMRVTEVSSVGHWFKHNGSPGGGEQRKPGQSRETQAALQDGAQSTGCPRKPAADTPRPLISGPECCHWDLWLQDRLHAEASPGNFSLPYSAPSSIAPSHVQQASGP